MHMHMQVHTHIYFCIVMTQNATCGLHIGLHPILTLILVFHEVPAEHRCLPEMTQGHQPL